MLGSGEGPRIGTMTGCLPAVSLEVTATNVLDGARPKANWKRATAAFLRGIRVLSCVVTD
jgi:hypothetical protein